jgi:hypothetical protein
MTIQEGCHAEVLEAWWGGPLRATLRQAQGDRSKNGIYYSIEPRLTKFLKLRKSFEFVLQLYRHTKQLCSRFISP